MADKAIDGLTAAGTLAGADLIELLQSGNSRKLTLTALFGGIPVTLTPVTSGGAALGSASLMFSDAFFASGAVINFNADVTITHAADTLTLAGASSGYSFDSKFVLASGFVLDWNGGDVTLTHSANTLTWAGATAYSFDVVPNQATNAHIWAATATKIVSADLLESASAKVALIDAATVAVDWDAGINFSLTVTANRIIGNPTNGQPGTWRTILVQGNDATDRTITFDTQYLGEVPTITTCDSGVWFLLTIFCVTTTHFVVSSKRAKG